MFLRLRLLDSMVEACSAAAVARAAVKVEAAQLPALR